MKKILVALLIACMVLSVSSVALAGYKPVTNENKNKSYTSLEEALADAAAGDTIKLRTNIEIPSKITITKGITLDGNGKTLTYTGKDRAIDMPNGADDAGANDDEIIIKDLNVECSASSCQRGINYNASGKLTLENVTVKGNSITYAINMPGSADNCEVTINGGSYTGCIALNVWGSDSEITATGTTFTTIDNADHEGYCTIKLNNNGSMSAEGTVVTINGGKIEITGSNPNASSLIGNATLSGEIINNTGKDIDVKTNVAIVSFNNTTDQYGLTTLQNAVNSFINYKATATEITLLRNVEEEVEVPEPIVLNVNGFKNNGTIYLTAEDATVTAEEVLNVESKVDGLAVVYEDGVYKLVPGYTITFDANGGSGSMKAVTVAKDTEYTIPANGFTAPEGKQFSCWKIEDDGVLFAGDVIEVTENITLIAVWEDIAAAPVVTPAPTAAPAAPAAPKTGDNTNIALWMALMAISCVALVGLRKKSKASK